MNGMHIGDLSSMNCVAMVFYLLRENAVISYEIWWLEGYLMSLYYGLHATWGVWAAGLRGRTGDLIDRAVRVWLLADWSVEVSLCGEAVD